MWIDDFLKGATEEIESPKITKDEYITKARKFISEVERIYWSNWEHRTLNEWEYPEESRCDNCEGAGLVTLNGKEFECRPDHSEGVCYITAFDDDNYIAEMDELMANFDYMLSDLGVELIDKDELKEAGQ